MRRPLLLLGLDGLDPDVVRRLAREVRLPNLERLVDPATSQPMAPGEERYTGLAWEQFSSGLEAASGGRTSAVSFDPATYAVTQPVTRLAPFTADLDARVVAFDVPYFDLTRGNARGLARWGAHDPGVPRHARPAALDAEISARFGPYPAEPWIYGFVWPDAEATRRMGADLLRALEVRTELTTWLLAERLAGWDLGLTVVAELHSASEALWHGIDETHPLHDRPSARVARAALVQLYRAVDLLVERVSAACPDADVLAFTPHGMGRNRADVASMLLLPELLYRWETGRRAFEAPDAWQSAGLGPAAWEPGADWSHAVLGVMGKPRPRRSRLRSSRPAESATKRRGLALDWMPTARYAPAWPSMRAFALPSFYDGRVRFNVKGREAAGCVRPQDVGALLEEVRALFRAVTDSDTGEPLDVELLSPHDGSAPPLTATDADLVVRWGRATTGMRHPRLGVLGPAPWRRAGGHTGGDGRIATDSRARLGAPAGLGGPASLAAWIRDRFAQPVRP